MRAFNRVLSAFLAAILIVVGVLTILEICRAALNQPPAVVQWPKLLPKLRSNSYDDAGPILVCVGLAVVGLLILISGIRRGKPFALPAGSTAPGVRAEIHRRSLQRAMRTAVVTTDRVENGTVTLRRRSARVVAHANTHTIDGLDADIRRRLEKLLGSIALVEPPRLKIKTYPAPAPQAPKSVPVMPGNSTRSAAQTQTPAPEPAAKSATSTTATAAEPVPTPARQQEVAAEPDAAPQSRAEPAPETTRLDDLLSHPEDGESR